jgi:hypothetical protein
MTPDDQFKLRPLIQNLNLVHNPNSFSYNLPSSEHSLEDVEMNDGLGLKSIRGWTHFKLEYGGSVYRFKVPDPDPDVLENKPVLNPERNGSFLISSHLTSGLKYAYEIEILGFDEPYIKNVFLEKKLSFLIKNSNSLKYPYSDYLIVPPNKRILFSLPVLPVYDTKRLDNSSLERFIRDTPLIDSLRYSVACINPNQKISADWYVNGNPVAKQVDSYLHQFVSDKSIVEVSSSAGDAVPPWEVIVSSNLKPNLYVRRIFCYSVNANLEGVAHVVLGQNTYNTCRSPVLRLKYIDGFSDTKLDFGIDSKSYLNSNSGDIDCRMVLIKPFQLKTPGKQKLIFCIDPDNKIDEENENDNEASIDIEVER